MKKATLLFKVCFLIPEFIGAKASRILFEKHGHLIGQRPFADS
jgi:hypothetical protein